MGPEPERGTLSIIPPFLYPVCVFLLFGCFGGEDQFGEGSVSTHPNSPKILPNP